MKILLQMQLKFKVYSLNIVLSYTTVLEALYKDT